MTFRADRLSHLIPAVAFVGTVLCISALTYMKIKVDDALAENAVSFQNAVELEGRLLDLTRHVKDVEYDILHTQEALTDISATRGQDGLDDGVSVAEEASASFEKHRAVISGLSLSLRNPSIDDAITEVSSQYKVFYEQGRKMADAYVSEGPSGGNKMMPGFDAVAEEMQNKLSALNSAVAEMEKSTASETDRIKGEISAQRALAANIMVGLIGWVLVFCGTGAWLVHRIILRPLTASTNALGQIAKGNLAVAPIGISRKDEFGDLARAVVYFRESEECKRAMQMEAEQAKARMEAEKIQLQRAAEEDAEARMAEAMSSIGDGLRQLADGNLSFQLLGYIDPRFEQLRLDFNLSIANLSKAIGTVGAASRELSNSASEMKSASASLSVRTEQQAASLEETSAALGQISHSMRETTQRTQAALNLSVKAKENTLNSSQVVEGAISAMQRIEDASREIFTIISVIDEIAFQTNLLALNAGVEAARAGESGKGFAVVAQEVRELAQRAANAAKEIKSLISKSNVEVAAGVELVEATGTALSGIAGQVSDIAQNMDLITQAVIEQTNGIQEIAGAVSSMDQMTQQNASMVQQTAGVASDLATHAGSLNQQVAQFQLMRQEQIDLRLAS